MLYAKHWTRCFIEIIYFYNSLKGQKLFATLFRLRHIDLPEVGEMGFQSSLSGVDACLLSATLLLFGSCASLGGKIVCNDNM